MAYDVWIDEKLMVTITEDPSSQPMPWHEAMAKQGGFHGGKNPPSQPKPKPSKGR